MTNSEEVKKEINNLLDKGLEKEALDLLLKHFKDLKLNNLPPMDFIGESNFFLDTVIQATKQLEESN